MLPTARVTGTKLPSVFSVRRPTLVVVGPPGAGKSTVGRQLATRFRVEFTDADNVIVARIGKSIADMFLEDGEPAFRALERAVVAEALESTDGVLALGGGAVLADETRLLLREHRVVSLTVGLADGMRRTGMSTARPLLAGVNPRATFKALLDQRSPLYREVATVEVDTSGRSVDQVVHAALVALGELPADAPEPPAEPRPRRRGAPLPTPTVGAPSPDPGRHG